MKERIRQIMEEAGLSQQDFSARLGISPASLSSIFTGRTNPTNNHVQAIHRAFPEINVNWLLFGEGEMRSGSTSADGSSEAEHPSAMSENRDGVLPMFVEESLVGSPTQDERMAKYGQVRRETNVQRSVSNFSFNDAKNTDNIRRKIKEIRVFFDDGTYEAFVPAGK